MSSIVSIKLAVTALFVTAVLSAFAFSTSRSSTIAASGDPIQGNGAAIYANNCARCHGDDGEGDKGPAINAAKKQAKYRSNPQSLINKISNGGGKMPKFKTRLSAAEIRAVANYVKTL